MYLVVVDLSDFVILHSSIAALTHVTQDRVLTETLHPHPSLPLQEMISLQLEALRYTQFNFKSSNKFPWNCNSSLITSETRLILSVFYLRTSLLTSKYVINALICLLNDLISIPACVYVCMAGQRAAQELLVNSSHSSPAVIGVTASFCSVKKVNKQRLVFVIITMQRSTKLSASHRWIYMNIYVFITYITVLSVFSVVDGELHIKALCKSCSKI